MDLAGLEFLTDSALVHFDPMGSWNQTTVCCTECKEWAYPSGGDGMLRWFCISPSCGRLLARKVL